MEAESRSNQTIVRLSTSVWEASARDRAARGFSEVVDRLLRQYYFSQTPDEVQKLQQELDLRKKAAEPLLAEVQALEVRLAAAKQRAAQDKAERNEAWAVVQYARFRLSRNPHLSFSVWREDLRAKLLGGTLSEDVLKQIFREESETIDGMPLDQREHLFESLLHSKPWEASA